MLGSQLQSRHGAEIGFDGFEDIEFGAEVALEPYPDPTQFDPKSEYFDPKATEDKPRWWLVDFKHVATFKEIIPLEMLKADPTLSEMMVCQKGTRLSINPVEKKHFDRVLKIAKVKI